MSDLESELRSALKHGLLHLAFNKCWNGADWECTYRNTDNTLVSRVTDPDPVEVIKKALRAGVRDAKKTPPPKSETPAARKPRRRDAEDLI